MKKVRTGWTQGTPADMQCSCYNTERLNKKDRQPHKGGILFLTLLGNVARGMFVTD
jgi:hypothetical protein